ncbi:interleukin-4 [Triplophysa rosa]|uniref:Interleukin-4 n=1 Tax=Triplophysa rosa TaxID=992332 RepID=A0A9W7TS25_TRIRA|nr:interleukin-4 [Triplophysa rosa]KAI7801368.1 interleukin 4/13B [Triplophysa rosa]
MRTFLLLVLACVVVTESRVDDVKTLLLQESIESVNIILKSNSKEIFEQFVKDVFKIHACSEESLCRAAEALKHAYRNTELYMLRRRLYSYAVYTGLQNCTVPNADESSMDKLLNDLKHCCQKLLRQKKHR